MKLTEMQEELNQFEQEGRLRKVETKPANMTNFSSNDYLSLAGQIPLRQKFYEEYPCLALSSSSSRLIDGSYSIVMDLEKKLEEIYGKSALCFNSGFDANSSVIETIFPKKSLILTDRLNHASIYDGIIASNSKFLRYSHLDMKALEKLLKKYQNDYEDIVIISESIYSMDGDCADLEALVSLKKQYNAQLMIDEAHSYGVYGYGIAYEKKLVSEIDYLILPLGKGGASMGAFVLCDEVAKKYLINRSRKFIYSTALPPITHAWNYYVLTHMQDFQEEQEALFRKEKLLYQLLQEEKIATTSSTHIVSIVIGNNEKANALSKALFQKGFLIQAIKEPTVPKNMARLRLSLTSAIPEEEIKRFVKELRHEMDILFNGWGMTEDAFPHLSLEQVEVINYPYDIQEIKDLLEHHKNDTLYAVAWSFGAYYFSKLPKEIQNHFHKKIAINGLPETLGSYGILPKMCKFTLENLTPESLRSFYKNMDFHGNISKKFADIQEELAFFYENYQKPENPFDFAWIGENDRIFSAKKLIRYYEKERVPYQCFFGGHYPFHFFQNFFELLGDTKNDL